MANRGVVLDERVWELESCYTDASKSWVVGAMAVLVHIPTRHDLCRPC